MIANKYKNAIFSACLDIARQSNLILDDIENDTFTSEDAIKLVNEKLNAMSKSMLKVKVMVDKSAE